MAYVYYFMYGTEQLSEETAACVAREWGLKATDYYCDWCEKPLVSKTKCDGTEGPHPWRMQFLAMGNPLGDAGDFEKHVKLVEQMMLVPVEPTIARRTERQRAVAKREKAALLKHLEDTPANSPPNEMPPSKRGRRSRTRVSGPRV